MLVPKTIRIIQGATNGVASTLNIKLFHSAYNSLKYEKSLRILNVSSPEIADFLLPLGDAVIQKETSETSIANEPLICAAPTTHTINIAHSLNIGESLHGYFKQNGELLTLHSLPSIKPNTAYALADLLAPAAKEQQTTAQTLKQKLSLRGPWHCLATTADKLTIHTYPAPDKTPLFNALGINWYALAAFEAAGKPVSILRQDLRGTALFPQDEQPHLQIPCSAVYLDLDDTLIIHGAVNNSVLAMLNNCEKTNTPVHLITRHARDPHLTLSEHAVPAGRFASIVWITDGSPKSAHITAGNAIFIDDAFQERLEVENKGALSLPPDASHILHLA